MRSAIEGFFESISRNPLDIHVSDLRQGLEEYLRNKLEGISNPNLSLLMAFMRDDGDYHMLVSSDTAARVASVEPEIIGIGDRSLVRYLTDSLYHPNLTLKQGIALAAYLIWAAKKCCPEYCGGPTDVWVLMKPQQSPTAICKVVSESDIRSVEAIVEQQGKEHLTSVLDSASEAVSC
jgi:hypothetical protein